MIRKQGKTWKPSWSFPAKDPPSGSGQSSGKSGLDSRQTTWLFVHQIPSDWFTAWVSDLLLAYVGWVSAWLPENPKSKPVFGAIASKPWTLCFIWSAFSQLHLGSKFWLHSLLTFGWWLSVSVEWVVTLCLLELQESHSRVPRAPYPILLGTGNEMLLEFRQSFWLRTSKARHFHPSTTYSKAQNTARILFILATTFLGLFEGLGKQRPSFHKQQWLG